MEKNRPSRKLRLNRETVHALNPSGLAEAAGGLSECCHTFSCYGTCYEHTCQNLCTARCAPSINPGDTQCQCM